eukprot:scaffold976_cov161-Amphora_coffeaeformis.AAC.6
MKFTLVTLSALVASTSAFTASSFAGKSVAGVPTSSSSLCMKYKVAVVGGGPAGACAAEIFAQEKGIDTVLFERKMDNAKPCGGAIPLCMIGEFDIPEDKVDRKVRSSFRWLLAAQLAHTPPGVECITCFKVILYWRIQSPRSYFWMFLFLFATTFD